jgi:RNA recognition motif-containing protein
VKNLSYNTSEEELGGFFEKYGSLDSVRILRTDGRSRGIGFVTFKNKEDAQDAMKDGNRAEIDGR